MDIGSRVSSSSDNSEDYSSSVGSITPPPKPADSESSGKVNSRAPQDIWEELLGMKLVLASCEYIVVERSNQLSRLMDELALKDHQLALANRQVQLRDHWITKLEVKLTDVHKGRMQEANGTHANIRLLVDTEKECRQLRKRCRFWQSRALAKPNMLGNASHGEHSN